MGRRKIAIEKIENVKNRAVTFRKRRVGFLKKAIELSELCDVDVSIVITNKRKPGAVVNQENSITTFSSTNLSDHLRSYLQYHGETVHFTIDLQNMQPVMKRVEAEPVNVLVACAVPTVATPTPAAISGQIAPAFEVLRPIPQRAMQAVAAQPYTR